MPTLRRWFDEEGERLIASGKVELLDAFDGLRDATFGGDAATALRIVEDVRTLAEALDEPAWAVVADYYAATAARDWLGDLRRALRLATRAVAQAGKLGIIRRAPGLYAQETMLSAWLATDAPGYSGQVKRAAGELGPTPPDVTARFDLLRAACLALEGDGDRARAMALAALPALEWPEAFEAGVRAATLGWADRWEDAAAAYDTAAARFDVLGMPVEANEARLAAAEAWLAAGWPGDALAVVDGSRRAFERGVNRQHRARCAGIEGQALLALGEHYEAAGRLADALDGLEGLGWLRLEAELSLGHLRALRELDGRTRMQVWEAATGAARARIEALRSRDLDGELASLCGQRGT